VRRQDATVSVAAVVWLSVLSAAGGVTAQSVAEDAASPGTAKAAVPARVLPEFICTVRAYGGAGYDQFQRGSMRELGLDYVQGLVDFTWDHVERAFALRPKFDWFGLHTYHVPVTSLDSPDAYAGVIGLTNVRKFLDRHGYADKALWLNEGGFNCGEDLGGLPEQTHAEQVVETYVVSRTLGVNLKGWVYFEYFSKTHLFEGSSADPGLMTALDQHKPPRPRLAWRALQTLIKTVKFFEYDFDTKTSGAYNEPVPPLVYRFRHRSKPADMLWVVFSGWGTNKRKPATQEVTINIAPMSRAVAIDMRGAERVLQADSSGNVTVTAGGAPIYLMASP
jgi:hypothetical protein